MSIKKIFLTSVISLTITGCASTSSEIAPSHVSTSKYENYDCEKLRVSSRDNIQRTDQLIHMLDKKASDDSAQFAIGMILFWPALFALEGGDGVEAAEYSQLQGELLAMKNVSSDKQCLETTAMIKDHEEKIALLRQKKDVTTEQANNQAQAL